VIMARRIFCGVVVVNIVLWDCSLPTVMSSSTLVPSIPEVTKEY